MITKSYSGSIEFQPEDIEEFIEIESLLYYYQHDRKHVSASIECWIRDWMEWHVKNIRPDLDAFLSDLRTWNLFASIVDFFNSPDDRWDDMTPWSELSSATLTQDTLNLMGRAIQIREERCKDYLREECNMVKDGGDE